MRTVPTLLMLMAVCLPAAEAKPQSCAESAANQSEMNRCADAGYQNADGELNRIYQQIQVSYADDPEFLAKLKEAQRAWIRFRDAELAMKYPARRDDPKAYGSIGPYCQATALEQITRVRIETLRQWLDGAEEGDVCSGSIKSAQELQIPNSDGNKRP